MVVVSVDNKKKGFDLLSGWINTREQTMGIRYFITGGRRFTAFEVVWCPSTKYCGAKPLHCRNSSFLEIGFIGCRPSEYTQTAGRKQGSIILNARFVGWIAFGVGKFKTGGKAESGLGLVAGKLSMSLSLPMVRRTAGGEPG